MEEMACDSLMNITAKAIFPSHMLILFIITDKKNSKYNSEIPWKKKIL